MHRGLARPGITKVERPCGHALNPEPGRVSRRLHAGSRCVGNRDRPLWSLGIAAHSARHASGHNIGSNNHSGREKKNHSFSMASVGGPRGFERPTGAKQGFIVQNQYLILSHRSSRCGNHTTSDSSISYEEVGHFVVMGIAARAHAQARKRPKTSRRVRTPCRYSAMESGAPAERSTGSGVLWLVGFASEAYAR